MTQLNTEYPIEDQTFREWRKLDVQDHAILEKELGELYERHIVSHPLINFCYGLIIKRFVVLNSDQKYIFYQEMEGIVGCYTNEINDLSKVLLGRMKHR